MSGGNSVLYHSTRLGFDSSDFTYSIFANFLVVSSPSTPEPWNPLRLIDRYFNFVLIPMFLVHNSGSTSQ